MSPSLWLLSVAIALSCGPPTGAADSGESDSADRAGQVYRIVPKARIQTSYDFTGRLVILNQDVSFDVPPAYQKSFAFWTDRMKGIQKTELIQFTSVQPHEFRTKQSVIGQKRPIQIGTVKVPKRFHGRITNVVHAPRGIRIGR